MPWEQLSVTAPHIAFAITGFGILFFSTLFLFIREYTYISDSTIATVYGLIVGPHCLNWFDPSTWGNVDNITLELSRFLLVFQIFATSAELPKRYMGKNWRNIMLLLVPVMTFGWLLSSVFIWKLVPTLRWIEALCIAACVTATDPVLCSAIVGNGRFAKRIPSAIRHNLTAESGSNDGMAFPFVYLTLIIMRFEHHPGEIAKHYILLSVLYECVLGILIGVFIGYVGGQLVQLASRIIDEYTSLVFVVVQFVAFTLICSGVGNLTGTDELLVAFAAGAAFAWNGWFENYVENAHVSGELDLILNTGFFLYFGSVIPWEDFNNSEIGLKAWKLVIISILILLFRRIPIALALKPFISDFKSWKEALLWGHFGPIGVGGLFVALLARAQLENHSTTPDATLPDSSFPHYYCIRTIWPIACFLALSCIIVHGCSAAAYALACNLWNFTEFKHKLRNLYSLNSKGENTLYADDGSEIKYS